VISHEEDAATLKSNTNAGNPGVIGKRRLPRWAPRTGSQWRHGRYGDHIYGGLKSDAALPKSGAWV
jgi:hypothetical protein